MKRLIDDIHGISRKPPVQGMRTQTLPAWGAGLRLSPLAAKIAEVFATRSENGRPHDPQLDVSALKEATGAVDDDLGDAISELADLRLVKPHQVIGAPPFGYHTVTPTDLLFVEVDRHVMRWDAEQDALRVAAEIVNAENRGLQSREIASRLESRALRPTAAAAKPSSARCR